jgi:hypothetical protein
VIVSQFEFAARMDYNLRIMTLKPRYRRIATLCCTFLIVSACTHHHVAAVPPTAGTPSPQSATEIAMTLDQANTAAWEQAWTNLVNDARQTFTPSLPRLLAVEVDLVAGNPGPASDTVAMAVLDQGGEELAVVSQTVSTADCDHVLFVIPNGGVAVAPGEIYSIRLSGGTTFGWKYVVGGYEKGAASFNGRPLLPDARSTFLFRTFGAPQD